VTAKPLSSGLKAKRVAGSLLHIALVCNDNDTVALIVQDVMRFNQWKGIELSYLLYAYCTIFKAMSKLTLKTDSNEHLKLQYHTIVVVLCNIPPR
jgi:hypothetical protein